MSRGQTGDAARGASPPAGRHASHILGLSACNWSNARNAGLGACCVLLATRRVEELACRTCISHAGSSQLVSDSGALAVHSNVSCVQPQPKHVFKRTHGHRSAAAALRDGLIAAARPRDRGRRQANARHALARRDELTPMRPGASVGWGTYWPRVPAYRDLYVPAARGRLPLCCTYRVCVPAWHAHRRRQ